MATYYVRTDGHDTASGANNTSNSSTGAWLTIGKAATTVAAGDIVYIVATAGNAASYPTASLDYTMGAYVTPASGTSAAPIAWIGLSGVPTIAVPGLAFYNVSYHRFVGLYFVATGNANSTFGVLNGTDLLVRDCVLNLNSQAGMVGAGAGSGSLVQGGEVYGGTASPSHSAGAFGIALGAGSQAMGVHIWNTLDHGVTLVSYGVGIQGCLIHGCQGDGITSSSVAASIAAILANTISGCTGNGISITGSAGATLHAIANNLVTANGGYGLTYTDGSTATNDARVLMCDYNNYGTGATANTSGAYQNISAGAHDLNISPAYTNTSTKDYTPTAAGDQAGFPAHFSGTPI